MGKRQEAIEAARLDAEFKEQVLNTLLSERTEINNDIATARLAWERAKVALRRAESPEPTVGAIQFDLKFEARGIDYRYGGTKINGLWYLSGQKQIGRSYTWDELVAWIRKSSYYNSVKITQLSPSGKGKSITITK